ncbi:MAG TPA: hypothetical protein VFP87_15875 [Chitinophagaceae bacterium]|nr:hypothetical protein [Chitinophagaceae bacterium]
MCVTIYDEHNKQTMIDITEKPDVSDGLKSHRLWENVVVLVHGCRFAKSFVY